MGLDRLGITRYLAQFGAQALDMAVDGALIAHVGGHAQSVEQLFAAEHPLRLFEQALQQDQDGSRLREAVSRWPFLAGLIDMRLPLTFSLEDCALIGRIIRAEVSAVFQGDLSSPDMAAPNQTARAD